MFSVDLRKRILEAYIQGRTTTYEKTAEVFGVGRAMVSRLQQRFRETGNIQPLPVRGNHPRKVELDWLRAHAQDNPEARLIERIEAWEQKSRKRVASATMSKATRDIQWTFKKDSCRLRKELGKTSSRSERLLSSFNLSSKPPVLFSWMNRAFD